MLVCYVCDVDRSYCGICLYAIYFFVFCVRVLLFVFLFFFFSSRRRHTRCALVTGVQTCALPILAQHDRIARYRADILDEPRKMEGDLRIARPVARLGRRDGLRLTELVDLHNPGNDGAACRLPDQTCREPAGQREAAEKGQPPVPCLDAGRPDPIVTYLCSALIWGHRLGRLPIADRGTSKHAFSPFPICWARHRRRGCRPTCRSTQEPRGGKTWVRPCRSRWEP